MKICRYRTEKSMHYMTCGEKTSLSVKKWKYCPFCGGKLEKFDEKSMALWIAGENAWDCEIKDTGMVDDTLEHFGTKDEWIMIRIEEWLNEAKERR